MARILSEENLRAYLTWRRKPWGVADLLYERLPMLTVRRVISENDAHWPLCWTPGRCVQRGLVVCIESLKAWQAFRPRAAKSIEPKLGRVVPTVLMRFQREVGRLKARNIRSVSRDTSRGEELLRVMCRAVEQISAIKKLKYPTPMLGSKVMNFFLPEFFPVWDTAVVSRALSRLRRKGEITSAKSSDSDHTADEYGQYVRLMMVELREGVDARRLGSVLVDAAAKEYKDKFLKSLVAETIDDLTPIVFELCVIGYARRVGSSGVRSR